MRVCRLVMAGVVGLMSVVVACGLLVGGCSKPDGPGAYSGDPAPELLIMPVYSPADSSIYYVDSGVDSACYADYICCGCPATSQPGIYRLRLDNDDPAELVVADGFDPDISPDGSVMFYHPGAWSGPIMKIRLPDGEPELVKNGCFIRACWFSPDTLVVGGCDWETYFLDMSTDSLHLIEGLQFSGSFDVGPDGRIALGGTGFYDPHDSTKVKITSEGIRPRWSPDGKNLVFYRSLGSGNAEIRVTDLDGNQRILATGRGLSDPDYTSDGESIIYVKWTTPDDGGSMIQDGQIWIMSAADGSRKRQVTTWSRIRP